MSPTVFRERGYRFFFFSREEERLHIHVCSIDGESKFWILPEVKLARTCGLTHIQLREIQKIIEEHRNVIETAWRQHFGN